MKIRIKGNSVRLRLSKSEVEKMTADGCIVEKTSFGDNTFIYSLQSKADTDELSASFANGKLTVFIPASFVQNWSDNEIIGFDAKVNVNTNEQLYILVEKDFKCIDETTEDQTDNFDNPNITCSK